jgi:hypothetical protein
MIAKANFKIASSKAEPRTIMSIQSGRIKMGKMIIFEILDKKNKHQLTRSKVGDILSQK